MNKVVSLSYKKDTSTMTDQEKSDRCDELLHEFSQQYYLDAVGDSKTPAAKRARGLRALSAIEQSTCSPEPSERTLTQLKRAFNTTALHHNIDLTQDDGQYTNNYEGKMPITIDTKKFYFEGATKKMPRSKTQADAAANNSYGKGDEPHLSTVNFKKFTEMNRRVKAAANVVDEPNVKPMLWTKVQFEKFEKLDGFNSNFCCFNCGLSHSKTLSCEGVGASTGLEANKARANLLSKAHKLWQDQKADKARAEGAEAHKTASVEDVQQLREKIKRLEAGQGSEAPEVQPEVDRRKPTDANNSAVGSTLRR
mmetsp:Transcript_16657/g.50261  ORF Transcript_16657/g.50261 Transcript_16657/m.50261 type:complete len:309 (+) Transcript_16657:1383-2309(+)